VSLPQPFYGPIVPCRAVRGSVVATTIGLVVLLSGCSGGAKTASTESMAPAPTVDAETGSLVGLVFDPELTPLAGTNVSVKDGPSMQADAGGSFTFNGLSTGVYRIRFSREGFADLERTADIVPGEVTQMRVELTPIRGDAVYHWSFSRVGLVRIGQWSLQYGQHLVNNTAVDAVFCDPCSYPVTLQPDIVDAVTDVQYSRALSVPYVNEYVTLAYTVAQTTGGSLKLLMTHDFPPRQSYQWSLVQTRELRGYEKVRLEFHGPDSEPPGLMVNQKVEVWQTFAHGQMLPAGYTLLPP
jgi:hypothetical protein